MRNAVVGGGVGWGVGCRAGQGRDTGVASGVGGRCSVDARTGGIGVKLSRKWRVLCAAKVNGVCVGNNNRLSSLFGQDAQTPPSQTPLTPCKNEK